MTRSSAMQAGRQSLGIAESRGEVIAERREILKKGVYLGAAGALVATAGGGVGAFIPPVVNAYVDGTYDVEFSTSDADSAWHNHKADQKMNASDFPGPGYGAQGKIPELAMNVIVSYLIKDKVRASMAGTVDYGQGAFAAFNAKCKHFGCTAAWRTETEGKNLVDEGEFAYPVDHDFVVCSCHLGTYDLYNSAKVIYGPPPYPLDQLRVLIDADGQIKVKFTRYAYGRSRQV